LRKSGKREDEAETEKEDISIHSAHGEMRSMMFNERFHKIRFHQTITIAYAVYAVLPLQPYFQAQKEK
jgi:hypothetical protein